MASWLWHEWQRDPQAARITLTALVLGAVMALEALWPRRTARRRQRWFVNGALVVIAGLVLSRSEEHTSELQSLMRISYAVFCLKKKKKIKNKSTEKCSITLKE